MARVQAMRPENYHNETITAGTFQQGIGNAGRDIYNGEHLPFRYAVLNLTLSTGPVTVLHDCHPKASPSSTVPFRRDKDFVKRRSLDRIHQICAEPASRAALVGLGGVG